MGKIRSIQQGSLYDFVFFCEGCGCAHGIRSQNWVQPEKISDEDRQWIDGRWNFNGDVEKPTISPSIHVWTKDDKGNRITKCHSFVTDGKIQYLGDCQHTLANQTIDL